MKKIKFIILFALIIISGVLMNIVTYLDIPRAFRPFIGLAYIIIMLFAIILGYKNKNNDICLERQGYSVKDKVSLEKFIGKKVIEINDMYPLLIFEGEESLTVECSWRVRNDKTILVGSSEFKPQETHQKAYEKLTNLILGQEINDIMITSVVSDLKILFCNGVMLELFSNSNIYESWTLSDGKDFMVISLPGGKRCVFGK